MFNATRAAVALALAGIIASPANASDLTIGSADTNLGSLTLSGHLRARYKDTNFNSSSDQKLQFNAARINLDWKSASNLFGHAEYRCYQFSKLCDFSALVDGYMGYQINKTDSIKVGLQEIPFGPGRFWESTWYSGIATSIGLEDTHNFGVDYHFNLTPKTQVDLGYFGRDGGQYVGKSLDSARYTTNFVKPDDSTQSHLKEQNMLTGRVIQDLPDVGALKTNVGASYLYSELDNMTNSQKGHRQAWSAFSTISYNDLTLNLTGGQNHVTNKDPIHPDYSVMGSFDYSYNVANKGDFYTANLGYTFKNVGKIGDIMPYVMYSSFVKDNKAYKTSTRNIAGVEIDHNQFSVVGEYIVGKNDAGLNAADFAGSTQSKQDHMAQLLFIYNF
jgi:hypothetical protein